MEYNLGSCGWSCRWKASWVWILNWVFNYDNRTILFKVLWIIIHLLMLFVVPTKRAKERLSVEPYEKLVWLEASHFFSHGHEYLLVFKVSLRRHSDHNSDLLYLISESRRPTYGWIITLKITNWFLHCALLKKLNSYANHYFCSENIIIQSKFYKKYFNRMKLFTCQLFFRI